MTANNLEAIKLHKNLESVVNALESDNLGLSINQIMNNTRLSIKTVRNCTAVLLQENRIHKDEFDVFHYGPLNENVDEQHKPEPQTVRLEGLDLSKLLPPPIPSPLSPFNDWIERKVVETKTVRLTEDQVMEVLKHVFGMDEGVFYGGFPLDNYVVELKTEVVCEIKHSTITGIN